MKKQYPEALYLGIADGAKNNWSFLEQHTNLRLIDFFHATEYLTDVAQGETASLLFMNALEAARCKSDFIAAGVNSIERTLETVLR